VKCDGEDHVATLAGSWDDPIQNPGLRW
jgi:hypothetical protein